MGMRGLRNARRRVPQGCKDSRTQDARTQEPKDAGRKNTRMQGLENMRTREHKDSRT